MAQQLSQEYTVQNHTSNCTPYYFLWAKERREWATQRMYNVLIYKAPSEFRSIMIISCMFTLKIPSKTYLFVVLLYGVLSHPYLCSQSVISMLGLIIGWRLFTLLSTRAMSSWWSDWLVLELISTSPLAMATLLFILHWDETPWPRPLKKVPRSRL